MRCTSTSWRTTSSSQSRRRPKLAAYPYACESSWKWSKQAYGYAASFGLRRDCEDEVVRQLVEVQRTYARAAPADDHFANDEAFAAEQNARLVKNAEEYYRSMFASRISSWNLRDRHMAETLDAIAAHLERRGGASRIVVWAHNSHLGDARATEMAARGELNLGQLVHQRHGDRVFNVGFSTYAGNVTAADDWGSPAWKKSS